MKTSILPTSIICLTFQLIITINILTSLNAHRGCGLHLLKDNPKVKINLHGNENPEISKLRYLQADWQPIRIYIDYTQLDSQTTVDAAKRAGLKKVVDKSKLMYESLLNVKRLTKKLTVNTCDDAVVGEVLKTTGVDADIVIFPHFEPSYTDSTEAAASFCAQDQTTGRPLVGYMKYSIGLFDVVKTNWEEYYFALTFHEMAHILVFNESLFDSYINNTTGKFLTKSDVTTTETINGILRTLIKTPKVVASAKFHFGCSTLTGVEVENQGGSGTKGSHWEARTMLGEYMIGESYDDAIISDMTLSLFEDSGWYTTNRFTGGLFRHGKNEGCDFLNKKCIINDKSNFPNEFCPQQSASTCTSGRLSKGSCSLSNAPANLDANYKYFSSGLVGNTKADFCPNSSSPSSNSAHFAQKCSAGGVTDLPSGLNEVVSNDSACFHSSIKDSSNQSHQSLNNFTICYKYSCDSVLRKVNVTIGSKTLNCPTAGGPLEVTEGTTSGTLWCPDYNLLCTKSAACTNMYDCIANRSLGLVPNYDYTVGQITSFSVGAATTAPTQSPAPAQSPITTAPSSTPASGSKANMIYSSLNILFAALFALLI